MFVKALIFFALNRNHPTGKLFLLSLKNREINNCKTGRLCERFICVQYSVADRGGRLRPKMFSISCHFLEIFGKIIGWRPLLEGWRPLLRGILVPPLVLYETRICCLILNYILLKAYYVIMTYQCRNSPAAYILTIHEM